MKYDDARARILDGDLIAFRTPTESRGSWYSHAAIALRLDGGLWCAEMGLEGNRLTPLSSFQNVSFDVFDSPVARTNVRHWVLARMREPLHCGPLDLARAALDRLLGEPLTGPAAVGYVAGVYLWAGWAPKDLPPNARPEQLARALGGAPKFTVETM